MEWEKAKESIIFEDLATICIPQWQKAAILANIIVNSSWKIRISTENQEVQTDIQVTIKKPIIRKVKLHWWNKGNMCKSVKHMQNVCWKSLTSRNHMQNLVQSQLLHDMWRARSQWTCNRKSVQPCVH